MKPLAQNTLIQNRYLIVHLIGKGGMGEVYLAVDQRLGSAVALKRTFFAGDEMLGNAFEREARTLARMRHPVLPKVSDHFGEGEEQYLVMEHISGDDLAKRLEAAGKPFPVSWVLFWADQLLDALSYLHTHEPPIIHRDIKPQNLKLTDENHIILLDFGLSKTSTGQTNISQSGSTGSVVGYTPHYAPMEQIRGIGTSPRSDLYSLSATLYQLLTNTVPTDALTRADAMLNGMADPIKPPHEFNPEVPSVVSDVILKGMEVSQEKRYANAREMQRVLRKAFNELQQATSASTVAFTAEQAEAAGVVRPETREAAPLQAEPAQGAGGENAEPPVAEPIDLEATMAYGSFEPNADEVKQSGVVTEVFNVGGTSQPDVPPVVTSGSIDESDPADRENAPTSDPYAQSGGGTPVGDATVPFIALDHSEVPAAIHESDPPESPAAAEDFAESESEAVSGPASRESIPEVPAAASYAATAQPATAAPKKSSGKTIALVGGLVAVLLLAGIVGGGIWAYVKYGDALMGAKPTPTPEPSPVETVEPSPTPSPEPTIESNVNSGVGNSNVSNSSSNTNSSITVEPTPRETPEPEVPSGGTKPTPRPQQQQTPRPVRTPGPKPTPARTPFKVIT